MNIHICLYLNGEEVINVNGVKRLGFFDKILVIYTSLNAFYYSYNEFDKIEVDYND